MLVDTEKTFELIGDVIETMRENYDSFSYIVEKESYKLLYISGDKNNKLSDIKLNALCYSQLENRTEPCETCPIKKMASEENHIETDMFYSKLGLSAKASVKALKYGEQEIVFLNLVEVKSADEHSGVDLFTSDVMLHNALSKSTDDFIFMCDVKKNRWLFPKAMVDEFNLPSEVFYDGGNYWANLVHEADRKSFDEDLGKVFSGETNFHDQEYRAINKNGQWVWLRCRGKMGYNNLGERCMFAGVVTMLNKKNKIDYTSGLLNKYEFEKMIYDGVSKKSTRNIGVLLLGMDNFRHINNLYGWEFGDEVIRITATKMQSIMPREMDLFRFNGDVFGLCMSNTDGEKMMQLYENVKTVFDTKQELNGNKYFCTFSGGCVIGTDEKSSVYNLMKRAEYALDCAKADGKNRLNFYNPEGMSGKERELNIIQSLRESVYNKFKDFEVFYQPQIDAKTQKVISAEALLRWNNTMFGNVGPADFVPLLEESGLIHNVGRWILEEVVNTCKEWRAVNPEFVLSVNLSYLQLLEKDLIEFINKLMDLVGIPSEALHLEITESCIASGSKSISSIFDEIRDSNMIIAMDDFGTGYSSLEILKNKPADIVKIDRAFVKDITKSDFDATFISFVVALCHSVKIKVCLEGIETWEEYELVKPMNIDIIQGFLFGKPVNKRKFETLFLK